MAKDVQAIDSKTSSLQQNQKLVQNQLLRASEQDLKMDQEIQLLKKECERLEGVNTIWKRNFKIINSTFTAMRG